MKLPQLSDPPRYQGLYVFDFGEWSAVGYTADEIAMLVESERFADGKVYRIHRATPDGQLELQGVARERFLLESGMFFYRRTEDAAATDFAALVALARDVPPPARAFAQVADRGTVDYGRYVTALIYPAEYDEAFGQWLLAADYAGGDTVEGGPSCVTNFYEDAPQVLEREQLWSGQTEPMRTPDEVFATVRQAVQR